MVNGTSLHTHKRSETYAIQYGDIGQTYNLSNMCTTYVKKF